MTRAGLQHRRSTGCDGGSTRLARHRGFTLLFVLLALVLLVGAASLTARVRLTDGLARRALDDRVAAADLADSAEAALLHWLTHESAGVVLPVDATTPAVVVLDDRFQLDGRDVFLHVVAFDQLGMSAWDAIRDGTGVDGAHPPWLRSALEAADARLDGSASRGLDALVNAVEREGAILYPAISGGAPRGRRTGASVERADGSGRADVTGQATAAIGALVATHAASQPSLNVNTAPMTLIEAALRRGQRGGIEAIRIARSEGRHAELGLPARSQPATSAGHRGGRGREERGDAGDTSGHAPGGSGAVGSIDAASIGTLRRPGLRTRQSPAIQLVGESDAWAFRIDATVDRTSVSRWCVCRLHHGRWRLVQRLVIDP
ncbi:MAG TPA: hypothetical protein PKC43_10220 [Phycisphaerales bacterium]|nr:hypothetical protein [Phycisphaerales bacterium]HMP37811.1 hypothetical protein [Phycisphaerales bacterium]